VNQALRHKEGLTAEDAVPGTPPQDALRHYGENAEKKAIINEKESHVENSPFPEDLPRSGLSCIEGAQYLKMDVKVCPIRFVFFLIR